MSSISDSGSMTLYVRIQAMNCIEPIEEGEKVEHFSTDSIAFVDNNAFE